MKSLLIVFFVMSVSSMSVFASEVCILEVVDTRPEYSSNGMASLNQREYAANATCTDSSSRPITRQTGSTPTNARANLIKILILSGFEVKTDTVLVKP